MSAVFEVYEQRLRGLGVPPGGAGLSNRQRDLVRAITKNAETALSVLQKGSDDDPLTALERAYKNGEHVEERLDKLLESLNASSVSHFASTGSRMGHAGQLSLPARSALSLPAAAEHYHAAHVVPPLPDNVHVEFDSQDKTGQYRAPEGDLKATLLKSTSSNSVIAARGAATSAVVHGASGMAGVGKTTALIALGHDKDVRSHFCDGGLFMTLGADVSVNQITDRLARIMKFTGARGSVAAVQNEIDLETAVNEAALWFQGKRNLFLVDDVWSTSSSNQGYLPQLRAILTGSTESRIVLTTRNRYIVSPIGSYIDFGARDVYGHISRSIFMR